MTGSSAFFRHFIWFSLLFAAGQGVFYQASLTKVEEKKALRIWIYTLVSGLISGFSIIWLVVFQPHLF